MKLDGIDVDFRILGAYFAGLSDEQQAAFFSGFSRELQTWGSQYRVEIQLSSIDAAMDKKDTDYLAARGFYVFMEEEK